MVEAKVRIGLKGQLVIPKLLREEYGMVPGREVILKEADEGILIKKKTMDPIAVFEKIARMAAKKKAKVPGPHAIHEQYEQRVRRAGIKLR